MFEKVNPSHPDKLADRIAGAIVDLAYRKSSDPKVAAEVLLGHKEVFVIIETSEIIEEDEVANIVSRIAGLPLTRCIIVPQDKILASNQANSIKCGDNGVFKGVPVSEEELLLSAFMKVMYKHYPSDGKAIIDDKIIWCQSYKEEKTFTFNNREVIVNPLGYWTGGPDVDAGATNRKLGSDMGRAVTGGGLHGKDLSKADVSLNIYAHLEARRTGKTVELSCAIGDETINGVAYTKIVKIARLYIESLGGFEKFAEWGLI